MCEWKKTSVRHATLHIWLYQHFSYIGIYYFNSLVITNPMICTIFRDNVSLLHALPNILKWSLMCTFYPPHNNFVRMSWLYSEHALERQQHIEKSIRENWPTSLNNLVSVTTQVFFFNFAVSLWNLDVASPTTPSTESSREEKLAMRDLWTSVLSKVEPWDPHERPASRHVTVQMLSLSCRLQVDVRVQKSLHNRAQLSTTRQ